LPPANSRVSWLRLKKVNASPVLVPAEVLAATMAAATDYAQDAVFSEAYWPCFADRPARG
jgi:hypothetical protein